MAINQFIGQLALMPFDFAPKGWALCNGALLSIQQNQPLFSLLGTQFGGDGITTFGLPNLKGRTPVGFGGPSGITMGQTAGTEGHSLTVGEVPPHIHTLNGTSGSAALSSAPNNLLGTTGGGVNLYSNTTTFVQMNAGTVSFTGNSAPHENRTPYLVMNWCISLVGIFPSRN